jgi:hypothetical protein
MKFSCGLTPDEKRELQFQKDLEHKRYLEGWHDFFALWPRQVASGDCRWLETIERKGERHRYYDSWGMAGYVWTWEYREKDRTYER